MEISLFIDEFVSQNLGYTNDINNFKRFILEGKEYPLEDTVFGGLDTDDIIESIKFNIENSQYKSKSIARKYSVAVAQFFIYAINKNHFKNKDIYEEILAPKIDDKSYYGRVNTFISKSKKLNEKEPITTFSDAEVRELIDILDKYLEQKSKHRSKRGYEKTSASLCIKLMLLTGIKYNVAREIMLENINTVTNNICINGFNIRLPLQMSEQFRYFVEELQNNILNNVPKYLFTDHAGRQWGKATSTSKIPNIIAQCFGRTDTTGLTKYGISNLINAGVSDSIITKLTNADKDIINSCITFTNDETCIKWDKYINSRFSIIDIYYEL